MQRHNRMKEEHGERIVRGLDWRALNYRGFREVDIAVAGVNAMDENDHEFQMGVHLPTRFAPYKNNLTALSQRRNLLFVAFKSAISVYTPSYPEQSLGRPKFCWLVANPEPAGYNPDPEAIVNHVVVGDLGHEEILVCACDNGDVYCYYTRAIEHATKTMGMGSNPKEAISFGPPLFYHFNVGMSAWGIAIHKHARMVAVSSNSHRVTVKAFALAEREASEEAHGEHPAENGHDSDDSVNDARCRRDRAKELKLSLRGHDTNIPSISFCNDSSDPTGKYLVSSDIEGTAIIWHVWKRTALMAFDLRKSFTPEVDISSTNTRGWTVLCLPNNTFREAIESRELFGFQTPNLPESANNGICTDLVRDPLTFDLLDGQRQRSRYPARQTISSDLSPMDMAISPDAPNRPPRRIFTAQHAALRNPYRIPELSHVPTLIRYFQEPWRSDSRSLRRLMPNQPSLAAITKPSPFSTTPSDTAPGRPLTLPFHILYADSTTSVLISPPYSQPHTVTPNLLSTSFRSFTPQSTFPHLNLAHHIPDIGVAVLGGQEGRVAIFSTMTSGYHSSARRYLRLDWTVPFETQEGQKQRPRGPLVGVSVGPVQGYLKGEEEGRLGKGGDDGKEGRGAENATRPRKWRLLLVYDDLTVLSYELWRVGRESERGDWDEERVYCKEG